jgi:hexosaminidase
MVEGLFDPSSPQGQIPSVCPMPWPARRGSRFLCPPSLGSPSMRQVPDLTTSFLVAACLALPFVLAGCSRDQALLDPALFPLIPLPADVDPGRGEFVLTEETRVFLVVEGRSGGGSAHALDLRGVVERWLAPLREASGLPLPVVGPDEAEGRGHIRISLQADPKRWDGMPGLAGGATEVPTGEGLPGVQAEAYQLKVGPREIELEASALPGIFYGLGTLGQLIPGLGNELGGARPEPGALSPWAIPAVRIEDTPRFPYRGMHLDVGRHFFPVPFVKRYLDLLAAHKMNVFHWHLTEDQGWRMEILRYPGLTEVGSCRAETILEKNFDPYVGDGIPYCGHYTQEDVREVVAYAKDRFITVIPEIEMPGHSVAALAAYPELACTPGPFQVHTVWGVTRDIFCPSEETFTFLEGVLEEVMELFPSPYIHIGGDEVPKDRWRESELAQEVIRREGLADEEELQSWFIRRVEAFLNANGRNLMGWDEILEGGLAPNATVMSWRGTAGGIEAARAGHDVVMTPNSHVYFDHYQGDSLQEPLAIGGFSPLERVYAFEPVPEELTAAEARHVLGGQANLWTEYIKTPEHAEYMLLPRMLALAEVVWSPADRRSWEGFTRRLPPHLERLDAAGIHYRIPDVMGLEEDRLVLDDSVRVELAAPAMLEPPTPEVADPAGASLRGRSAPRGAATIVFTLDGTDPGPASPLYQGPFSIPVDEAGTEVAARVIMGDGRAGAIRRARFTRAHLAPPAPLPGDLRAQGLAVEGFRGWFRTVDAITGGERLEVAGATRATGGTPAARGPDTAGRGAPLGSPGTPQAPPGPHPSHPRVTLPNDAPAEGFGLRLTGYVRVPRAGIYTFVLSSDDGSRLSIGDRVVVDHDGPHAMSERRGQVALHRGWHPLEVLYFQAGGGKGLLLEVEGPGVTRREVPATWLAQAMGRGP